MKKIIATVICFVSVFFSNAEESSGKTGIYCGISLDGTWTSSEYQMNFTVNTANFEGCGGVVKYKEENATKFGGGIFLGCGGGNDFYCAAEVGILFNNFALKKTFSEYEALEIDIKDREENPNTFLKCSYGNEYQAALKLGKVFTPDESREIKIYGILGVATRKASVQYDYAKSANSRPHSFEKNIHSFVPGIGMEVKLQEHCSLGVEYKYKAYQDSKSTHNFVNPDDDGDFDLEPRHYSLKTKQHNVSLRLIFNI
ncbi:MAG: outer membrane beta-barrel protein [Holosporaceae bacterium]|jgi:opacity protein-like surface antigen|nr:outer membrane beta-barrel protein [Holosporaceae bacterium]